MKEILILPKGVTGFTSFRENFELPELTEEILSKVLDDLELRTSFKRIGVMEPTHDTNYYSVFLKNNENKKLLLLFNGHHPYYASITTTRVNGVASYLESVCQEVYEVLDDNGFVFLSKEILNTKINNTILRNLTKAELEEIEYWQSETIGEVVFNRYD